MRRLPVSAVDFSLSSRTASKIRFKVQATFGDLDKRLCPTTRDPSGDELPLIGEHASARRLATGIGNRRRASFAYFSSSSNDKSHSSGPAEPESSTSWSR